MNCCVEKRCWCFVSDGMGASNQEEIVVLIQCGSYEIDEITVLRKVLQQMNSIFEKAKHGENKGAVIKGSTIYLTKQFLMGNLRGLKLFLDFDVKFSINVFFRMLQTKLSSLTT